MAGQDQRERYEAAVKAMGKIETFVLQLEWQKQKTENDHYHEALCAGIHALCMQNMLIFDALRAVHRALRESPRSAGAAAYDAAPAEAVIEAEAVPDDAEEE